MRVRILLLSALLVLALAQVAQAQGGATMTIAITDLAPTATAQAGQPHQASFKVIVSATGFQCVNAGSIKVDLAVTNAGAAPAGVVATVDPANLTFPVQPGPYGLPVIPPGTLPASPAPDYNQSLPATLKVTVPATATGSWTASVSASSKGGSPCDQSPETLPAAQATAQHAITFTGGSTGGNGTTPSPTPSGGPGTNNTGNSTDNGSPPPAKSPGFESVLLVGAGAIAVAIQRRRQA